MDALIIDSGAGCTIINTTHPLQDVRSSSRRVTAFGGASVLLQAKGRLEGAVRTTSGDLAGIVLPDVEVLRSGPCIVSVAAPRFC